MPYAEDRLSKLQALKLLQAVSNSDVDLLIKLIDQGIPNLVNVGEPSEGQYGLHLATCANSELMIKTLVQLGADCNVIDKKGRTPYIRAAEYGHLDALTLLIQSCEDPDLSIKDVDGKNILSYCLHATNRHQLCMESAIRFGANIHNVGCDGKSLAMLACEDNLITALKTFLQAGIDVNKRNEKTGETAIHITSERGFEECTRLLLQFSADPNILDMGKLHPAHKAAKNGHLRILQILSAYGAKFDVSNGFSETPMHFAAKAGHAPLCKFLGQRGCPAVTKNALGNTAKVIAKELEHKDCLKECKKAEKYKGVKHGTQVHIVKITPFSCGTLQIKICDVLQEKRTSQDVDGKNQFYDWLMEKKSTLEEEIFDYDIADSKGKRSGKIQMDDLLSILLLHNSPLEETDVKNILKLHDTHKSGKIDYALFFWGKKFVNKEKGTSQDVDVKNQHFMTAGGKEKGTSQDVNVKNQKKKGDKKGKKGKGGKKTKIDMPICTNVNITRSRDGGPMNTYIGKQEQLTDKTRFDRDHQPLHPIQDDSLWYCHVPEATYVHLNEVIKYNDKESLKAALRSGFDINQTDKYYKTPLMSACIEGNLELAKYLIEQGANVTLVDNFKWSALHFACHVGMKDLVELLVNNGALIDAQSFNGGTPLMRAIESAKVEVVEYLLHMGAKLHLENKKGQTALDIAISYSDPRVYNIVQERWDQLPPPTDKRKKAASAKKQKKNTTSKSSSRVSVPNVRVEQQEQPDLNTKKPSILRAASALADGQTMDENIAFAPKKAWLPESTTDALLKERQVKRERYGYEIDFPDYKPPYEKHVDDMVQVLSKAGLANEDD